MPTISTPNAPHTPCTEIAPHGSSMPRRSQNSTLYTTMMPAMMPITDAAHGAMNAHGAVTATRPASMPLHDIEMSGLPYFTFVNAIAATNPVLADNSVLTATRPMRKSVAPSVEPGLKPLHLNTSTSVPSTT